VGEIKENEKDLMRKLSRMERRGSELDFEDYPPSEIVLDWRKFNSDFKSTNNSITEVMHIVAQNLDE